MHGTILIRVNTLDKEISENELRCSVSNILDAYNGEIFDYYDLDSTSVESFITTKDGKQVQMCHASEFSEFTHGYPYAFLWYAYMDMNMYDKYNFDWCHVVDTEMKEAIEADAKHGRTWIVACDLHY